LKKVTEAQITASKVPDWIEGDGAKAADYVLVLMEAP
jgi:hypothetical protein